MSDRIYPSAKQNTPTARPPIPPPPSKSHLYNPNRHPHRPPPTPRRRRTCTCRRCFCLTFFYSILILIFILLAAAIAAAVFYTIYHPHRPTFSVTSVKITSFNLTTSATDDTTHLTSKINVTLSTKNPNKKITFTYTPVSISVVSNSVTLGNGTFTNFTHNPDSIYVIHTAMGIYNQILDGDSVNQMNLDLKRRNGLPMKIVMETMVGVKLEKTKMKKVGIKIVCDGIHGEVPKGKNGTEVVPANTVKAKCDVGLKIKIWKWTF